MADPKDVQGLSLSTPHRVKRADFQKSSRPIMGAAAEALNPMAWNLGNDFDQAPPMVLLSRYRDNIYVAMANVPDAILQFVRCSLPVLLRYVHNIPLKWEPHRTTVASGEGVLFPCPAERRVVLRRKGVCTDLRSLVPSVSNVSLFLSSRYSAMGHRRSCP